MQYAIADEKEGVRLRGGDPDRVPSVWMQGTTYSYIDSSTFTCLFMHKFIHLLIHAYWRIFIIHPFIESYYYLYYNHSQYYYYSYSISIVTYFFPLFFDFLFTFYLLTFYPDFLSSFLISLLLLLYLLSLHLPASLLTRYPFFAIPWPWFYHILTLHYSTHCCSKWSIGWVRSEVWKTVRWVIHFYAMLVILLYFYVIFIVYFHFVIRCFVLFYLVYLSKLCYIQCFTFQSIWSVQAI